MRDVLLGRARSAAVALCALLAAGVLSSCGGDDGTSGSPGPTPTNTPTETATPVPGQFNGNYAGTVALDAGQTGVVMLTVQNEQTSGTLTITGGATPETVTLTGTVDQLGGTFSTSGKSADGSVSAVVSGMLPVPGGIPGFLAIQIGSSLTPFRGTISPV